jgi:hypothetical protein
MSNHRPLFDEPLRLVHHHPGRLRARANIFLDAKADHPAVVAARLAAASTPGFVDFSHTPNTGSIAIEYQPGILDPDDLLERLAIKAGLHGVVHDTTDKLHRQEILDIFLDTITSLNDFAGEVAVQRADLRELVPAALAIASAVSFVLNKDSRRLPRWDSALWWSYSVFLHWHRKGIEERSGTGTVRDPNGPRHGNAQQEASKRNG